ACSSQDDFLFRENDDGRAIGIRCSRVHDESTTCQFALFVVRTWYGDNVYCKLQRAHWRIHAMNTISGPESSENTVAKISDEHSHRLGELGRYNCEGK
uniref:Uncharacterized protein n=1 Tax=Parascaris equorum TaxID=6256 RepID=A0A914RTJ8_PAREQ